MNVKEFFRPTGSKILAVIVLIVAEFVATALTDGISDLFLSPALVSSEVVAKMTEIMSPAMGELVYLGLAIIVLRYLLLIIAFYIAVCTIYNFKNK